MRIIHTYTQTHNTRTGCVRISACTKKMVLLMSSIIKPTKERKKKKKRKKTTKQNGCQPIDLLPYYLINIYVCNFSYPHFSVTFISTTQNIKRKKMESNCLESSFIISNKRSLITSPPANVSAVLIVDNIFQACCQ